MSDLLTTGYMTLREAAEKLTRQGRATDANKLRAWLYANKIQTGKIGKTNIVHEKDLIGYMPRGMKG